MRLSHSREARALKPPRRAPLANAFLLGMLLWPSAFALGDTPQDTFEEANRLYAASRFQEAGGLYRQLLAQRPRSPDLHFNLGNAYFRDGRPGNLGRAIASYLRAFRLMPRDADIRRNLDFALRRAGEALIPPGTPPALFVLYHLLGETELAMLHWVGFWAGLLLGSAMLLRDRWREPLRAWLIGAIAFWALAGGWWGLRQLTQMRSPAVVLVHDAEVRSGPGGNFPVSFKVPEGRRVSQLDVRGDWIEIGVLQEGLKGWIAAAALEEIWPAAARPGGEGAY
ncbi:MAG: tetratricopeptide repeat protein [Elusimicrobiota bacterium]